MVVCGKKGQLDGEIEPGGKMRGDIPFDVAETDKYELHFSDIHLNLEKRFGQLLILNKYKDL